MAGNEDESQQIVADIIGVERLIEARRGRGLLGFDLLPQLFVLDAETLGAAELVERAVFRGSHQPRAGAARDARHCPFFQGCHQGVLRQVFGEAHVAHQPREAGNQFRGFHSPDGVNGAVEVGGHRGTGGSRNVEAISA